MKRYQKHSIWMLCVVFLAVSTFFFLFSELLNPRYIDWILQVKSDPFQHFVSWLFYRASPWQFPPFQAAHLLFPTGISIVFTDSIPLFAIIFKSLSSLSLLPSAPVQYFGVWLLLCFILQGVVAYVLLRKITQSPFLSCIGSVFFLLSPPLLLRMPGHFALSAHFLILLALLIYSTRKSTTSFFLSWAGLFIVSLLTHAYLFFMVGAIYGADILKRLFVHKQKKLLILISLIVVHAAVILLTMYIAGYFHVGSSQSSGFGEFSMNLLSLINPSDRNGALWSRFLPEITTAPYQYEGFNYLGIGILLQLILFLLFMFISKTIRTKAITLFRRNWPLLLSLTGLTLLAVSNIVYVGSNAVLSIPLSDNLQQIFNTFRSSGRFFWPVFYSIVLCSFLLYTPKKHRVLQHTAICFFLALQLFDFYPKLAQIDQIYEHVSYTSMIQDPAWEELAQRFDHVYLVPHYVPGRYEDITFFAATHGLTINSMYTARPAKDELVHQQQLIQNIKEGQLDKHGIYVFQIDTTDTIVTTSTLEHAERIQLDSYTLLIPSERYED